MELRSAMICLTHNDFGRGGSPSLCKRGSDLYQMDMPREVCMFERVVLVPTGTLKMGQHHDFTFGKDERWIIHDSSYFVDVDGWATVVNRSAGRETAVAPPEVLRGCECERCWRQF